MRRFRVPPLISQDLTVDYLASQDCVLVVTDHSQYDYDFIVRHAALVVDTRNATQHVQDGRDKVRPA